MREAVLLVGDLPVAEHDGARARGEVRGELRELEAWSLTDAEVRSVTVDGPAFHDLGASDAQELGWTMAVGVHYLRVLTGAGLTVDEAADAVAAYLPHRPKPRSTEGLKKNLRWRDGRWHWHWDPAFLTKPEDDPFVRVDKLEQAAINLEIPILLIRGKLSDVVSTEGVQDFLAKVPAEFVELSEAGHTAAGDDNDAFSDVVVRFVAS